MPEITSSLHISIAEATIQEIIGISQKIPEFHSPYTMDEYEKRLFDKGYLALKATYNGQEAGFKIGYELDKDTFYTWFGGVIPEFRQHGIATMLAREQEKWAAAHGYLWIKLKTRNYLKSMLVFALKRGFHIIDIEKRDRLEENRIILQKKLK